MKKSIQREVLEIVAAFIVAWLAYQLLAAVSGTPLPIVSVVGNSMYHTEYFDDWWDTSSEHYKQYGITREEFKKFPAPNGLSNGDLSVVVRADNPEIGDILIYRRFGLDFTVVHRLVEIGGDFYITKGDNNLAADPPVAKQHVVGKFVFAVPLLGYPRLVLHMVGI